MGMYDTIYIEFVCPNCGHEHKRTELTFEQAKEKLESSYARHKDLHVKGGDYISGIHYNDGETGGEYYKRKTSDYAVREFMASHTEGMFEAQTKEFECELSEYHIGDTLERANRGHYFVDNALGDCRKCKQYFYFAIEIKDKVIVAMSLISNPRDGEVVAE